MDVGGTLVVAEGDLEMEGKEALTFGALQQLLGVLFIPPKPLALWPPGAGAA